MKAKQKIVFCGIIFALFMGAGCKKYGVGPGVSLRTKKTRICGEWKIREWRIKEYCLAANGRLRVRDFSTNNKIYTIIIENENDSIIANGSQQDVFDGDMKALVSIRKDESYTIISTRSADRSEYLPGDTIYATIFGDTTVVEEGKWDFSADHTVTFEPATITTTIDVKYEIAYNLFNIQPQVVTVQSVQGVKKVYDVLTLTNKLIHLKRGSTEKVPGEVFEDLLLVQ